MDHRDIQQSGATGNRLSDIPIDPIRSGAHDHHASSHPSLVISDDAGYAEFAPFAVMLLDHERVIQTCNAMAASLIGIDRARVVQRSFLDFVAPRDIEVFGRHWRDVALDGRSRKCELGILHQDGSTLFVEIQTSPAASTDDSQVSYHLTMVDVSERRRLQLELECARSELNDQLRDMERLQDISMRIVAEGDLEPLLQEITNVAIEIVRADAGSMMLIEEATGDLLLRAQVGLRGKYLEACWRFDPGAFETACGKALRTAKRVVVRDIQDSTEFVAPEYIEVLSDSGIRGLESTPLVTRSGKVLGVMTTQYRRPTTPSAAALRRLDLLARQAADLIERAQAERATRESEQRFAQFMKHLPGLAWIKDSEGRYVYANEAAAADFRLSPTNVKGQTDADFFAPDVASDFRESDRHVLVTGQSIQIHEGRADPNGVERHALVSKFPIPSDDGRPPLVGGVSIDMTEWMRAEETIRRILEGIAPTTGQDFFRTLATHLGSVCNVDYAFVGRVQPNDPNTVRTIAISHCGELIDETTYDIRGTPCEQVMARGACLQFSDVQSQFPDDRLAVESNVNYYMGAPLYSKDGKSLGLVALMNHRQIAKPDQALAILRVVAARAGAELERDQAQTELDRTRLEFDFLAETFPSLIFRADRSGNVVSMNKSRWMVLTGNESDSWRGDGWLSAVHWLDRDRIKESWAKFVRDGQDWAEEFRFARADGGVTWVLGQAVPMRDASNHVFDFFGTYVDITHLIETKQALRLTQYSVDQASIAVYWIARDSSIRYVNDRACKSVGYARREMVGMSLLEIAAHTPASWEARFKEVKAKGSIWFESHHRRKDGTYFPVEVTVNYVRFGGEEFLFAFAQDVSERKRVEDRLERQSAELAHVSRLSTMGQMVATLSHELAQPLTAVANYASASTVQLRNADLEQSALAEYLEGISRQTTRAGEILQRVREFVRKTKPRKATCDLNLLLDDSLALLSNDFRRNGVKVETELHVAPVLAVIDRVLIQQVVVNLLTNARDAVWTLAPSKRVVMVRSFVEHGEAIIEIEDRGPGVSKDILDHLFEPFVTTKETGMGIGLSICKSIVASHRGSIRPGSGRFGGALFRVALPMAEDQADE